MRFISLIGWLPFLIAPVQAQELTFEAAKKILLVLTQKAEKAEEFAFEADLQVDAQRGTVPGATLAKGRVKLARAPGGKSFLHVQPAGGPEYFLVSDGHKSWAYLPRSKQYSEQESAIIGGDDEDGGAYQEDQDIHSRFAHLVLPTLAGLVESAQAVDVRKESAQVRFEGRKQSWPVVAVLAKKDAKSGQALAEIAINPETLAIGRLTWTNVTYPNGERLAVQMTATFTSFQLGGTLPATTFVFEPPKNAKRVDSVAVPGQMSGSLVNKPAPDFELKTLEGERIRLSELRKPVLLNFWASWCGPCRRELPGVASIHRDLNLKGLVVLGVNDEGKATARRFAAEQNLMFETLDDSAGKVHRLFQVRAIPSVVLIDGEGKVVRVFTGARSEAELREALKALGF